MKKLIFTLLFTSLSLSIFAQTGGTIMDRIDPNFLNNNLLYESGTYSSFDGNPYLFDEVQEACLLLSNGKELCDVKVNYDAFENTILLQDKDEDDVSYINPQFVRSFNVSGFQYKKTEIEGLKIEGYYKAIYEGNDFSLFLTREVSMKHRDNQGSTGYDASNKKSKYFSISENFVLVPENGSVLVESRLKRLLRNYDDFNYRDIRKYARSEDLDLDNHVDIVSLMKYLDKN